MTPEQKQALGSLARIWPNKRIYIVGAAALVIGHRLPPGRVTLDLDLAVEVPLVEALSALAIAPKWSQDSRSEQRWVHQNGTQVDLLPIGGPELGERELIWPGTGVKMNLEGFHLLCTHSRSVGQLPVEAAEPALIALLKMAAWLDRPQERKKDLVDLGFLFDHYLDPVDDRMFMGEAAELELFDEHANIYLLGLDMGRMDRSTPLVAQFLQRVRQHTNAQVELVRRWRSVEDEDALLERLELLERGFRDSEQRASAALGEDHLA